MAGSNGRRAVSENIPDSVTLKQADAVRNATSTTDGETGTTRLTMAHVLPLIFFPVFGIILFVVGMPVSEIPGFLLYCGGIGAAMTVAVTGGRRLLTAIAHGVIAANGK